MVHEIVEIPPSVPPPVPLLGGGRGGSGLGGISFSINSHN